jgi:hypothetical protein
LILAEHGDPQLSGIYYVHFFARHPADTDETDPSARWWPEWREYSTGDDGIIDYGVRVLFPPTRIPNAERFIAWADVVNLCDPAVRLLGPFNFTEPRDNPGGRSPSYRQYVPSNIWAQLAELCVSNGILPPRLTVLTPSQHKRRKRKGTMLWDRTHCGYMLCLPLMEIGISTVLNRAYEPGWPRLQNGQICEWCTVW